MTQQRPFPYQDGDITVLGPEVFASKDDTVISWRGANYLRQLPAEVTPANGQTERRNRYANAIRDKVRFRFGASVLALARQGRPIKMTPSEAETAADAVMAVEDAEMEEIRAQNTRMRHELEVMYGGSFDTLPSSEGASQRQQATHRPTQDGAIAKDRFTPPAADGLPLEALGSATDGATMLDAWAETGPGRNFLAHALIQLGRDGWLRRTPDPDAAFDVVEERTARPAPEPQEAP